MKGEKKVDKLNYSVRSSILCLSVCLSVCLYLRLKLRGFLEASTSYDPACLLTQVEDTDMYRECAILYGRVSDG